MPSPRADFFRRLFDDSLTVISRLPLTIEPPMMEHVTGALEPATETLRQEAFFSDPEAGAAQADGEPRSAGLNTIGMLLDRLSILAIKHWNLVHRSKSPEKAQELIDTQVSELVEALAEAQPGFSSINNKMTTRQVGAQADTFAKAYYGLLTTNLMVWETNELLYNHDILALPCEDLRAYMDFFSRGNLSRNVYIQSSDQLYWSARGRV